MMRTAPRAAALAALVSALLLGACGESVSGNVESLLDTFCDATFRCCTRGEVDYLLGPFLTEDDCKERLLNSAELNGVSESIPTEDGSVTFFNLLVVERAVEDGRAKINEDNLEACRKLIRETVCNQEPEEEPEGCVPPEPEEESPCELHMLVRGQVGHGGECSSIGESFECKEGLTCVRVGSLGVLGACVRPGKVGDLCFDDGECEEELFCSLVDGTCAERRLEGDACAFADSDDPSPDSRTLLIKCVEGLSCDPVSETCVAPCQRGATCESEDDCDMEQGLQCISGRCDVPRALGEPCGGPNEDCEEGLRCDQNPANLSELICQEKIADLESCSGETSDDCASGFCDNVYDPTFNTSPTYLCQPSVPPGADCPTGNSDECAGGYCDTGPNSIDCTIDDQCPGGCDNLGTTNCFPICLALAADGVNCTVGDQCASGTCGADFVCRSPPLVDGTPCSNSLECESGFCNTSELPAVCRTKPLDNGVPCNEFAFPSECASEVCFNGECVTGLSEGADCSSALDPPCSKLLYCDTDLTPAQCVPKLAAGAECESPNQCIGDCEIRFGRMMCDATAPDGRLTCDGEGE